MSNLAHKRDRKNPMMNTPELFQSSHVFEKMGTIRAILWKPGLGEKLVQIGREPSFWSCMTSIIICSERVVENTINLSRNKCQF